MIAEESLSQHAVAAQVHAVAQAAYAVEAGRIGCPDFPPLRESLAQLGRSGDRLLVHRKCGSVAGALTFVQDAGAVDITRLVVSPPHFRQGVATALLAHLERLLPPGAVTVSTARRNSPAVALYRRLGYSVSGASISPEGIELLYFTKTCGRTA